MSSSRLRLRPANQSNSSAVNRFLAWLSLLPWVVVGSLPLAAEEAVQSAPADPVLAPYLRKQAPPPPLSQQPAAPETPYRLGPLVFHPRISARHLSVDGLRTPGGLRVDSEMTTFSPGLTVDMGDRWTLDYSPSRVSYSSDAMRDSTQHSARLTGGVEAKNWSLGFDQGYRKSNSLLLETGRQTEEKTWTTAIDSVYRPTPKIQLRASGSLFERYTNITSDQKTWSGNVSVSYALSPQLALSLNPEFSYTEVSREPDYSGDSYLAQLSWRPLDKVSLGMGGGVKRTHSKASSGNDFSTPLASLSLAYQPFETTSLAASLDRTASGSYFQSQATENLRWSLNLNQRLLGKLYLTASYSETETDYVALLNTLLVSRSDKAKSYSLRLSTRLLQRLSVSLVTQESKNSSNLAGFSFTSRQYGIELGYRY